MKSLIIGVAAIVVVGVVSLRYAQSQSVARPAIATEEDFRRAMKELSNWGRWGADDELGAANLITPAKREQALALAKEGLTVSLAHDVVQEKAADAPNILERVLNDEYPRAISITLNRSNPTAATKARSHEGHRTGIRSSCLCVFVADFA